jgi:hypothetical protein
VIPDARPPARRTTATYSLDGDRLKLETRLEFSADHTSTVTEWFTNVK